ncbi:MAG: hypothetical protein R2698_05125 [Microthrixaceae bacterium]
MEPRMSQGLPATTSCALERWCLRMELAVRGGSTLREALREATDDPDPTIRALGVATESTPRWAEGVRRWGEDGAPEVRALADGLLMLEHTGRDAAPTLHRFGVELRRTRLSAVRVAARTAPVRMLVPLVCCLLPSFVLLSIVPVAAVGLRSLGRL